MIDAAKLIPDRRRANKAELAAFFDVSLPTIEAWIRKGCPVVQHGSRGVAWVFDILAVVEWKYSKSPGFEINEDGSIDPANLPPVERKHWFDSELKRRELQKEDRELIQAAELESCVARVFGALSQGLRSIPDNLERRIGCPADVAEAVERFIEAEMDAAADMLSTIAPIAETCDE